MIGYFACAAMLRFWESPCWPQSSPWSLASVARPMLAALRAVMAEAGASKMYCLDWGSGQTPLVTAVSRLTMLSWVLAKSWGIVLPSAVVGLLASRSPTAPAKWTSPPKPRVTAFPSPVQSGFSGERLGKCWAAVTAVPWVVEVDWPEEDGGGLPLPPPEKKISQIKNKKNTAPPTANCLRRRRTLRETTAALCHT